MTLRRDQKERDTFHLGSGRGKQERTGQKVQLVFPNSVSKDHFSKPPRLHGQGHKHYLNCLRRTSVSKYKETLGNSLTCRHLMEHLLEKDYTEEQMCDFVFQLLKNTSEHL